jgi:hypothetical protein
MATKKKKTTKTKAANTNATENTTSSTRQSKKTASAFDFSSFMNPQQMFSAFTQQPNYNFKNANFQQLAEQYMQTSQKNMEALTACSQWAMERTKEWMEDQANFTNRLIQEATSTFQETMASDSDAKNKMEEIADYAKYCMEKAATQARKTTEENMQTAQKITTTLAQRATEAMEEIQSAA